MTGNTSGESNNNAHVFPGKIVVFTNAASNNREFFHSADHLVSKYGEDKIIHLSWPEKFLEEEDRMIESVAALADDEEVKVLIINQALPGSNAAIDKLREKRNDIFIICCTIHESPAETAGRADLILMTDELGMGQAMVKQARKQGAKTFIHYSFPRHMSQLEMSRSRDMIRDECEKDGIKFVEATALDYTEAAGKAGAEKYILEDVPRLVAKYGEDTAFFCTNCTLQASLIKAVVACHAIYPQPCCPSPYHGFPEALGIDTLYGQDDLNFIISEASRIAEEKNMTDRLSTWPVSASMLSTNAGAEYAIKWINGLVPKQSIDEEVLAKCMSACIKEVVGEGIEVSMTTYSRDDGTYENCKLFLMSYLDF